MSALGRVIAVAWDRESRPRVAYFLAEPKTPDCPISTRASRVGEGIRYWWESLVTDPISPRTAEHLLLKQQPGLIQGASALMP